MAELGPDRLRRERGRPRLDARQLEPASSTGGDGRGAEGAYLEDPATAKAKVDRIVQNAIDLGLYVIIDWHDHEALSHQAEAVAFFREMSETWGDYPNVIYEVFNEPLAVNWVTELAPYHRALVSAIRESDPDNLILLGTPNWDQDVEIAALNPISGKNLMYTLHFYACTHGAQYRNKAKSARALGLPLFVTEWGATHADGGTDGIVCDSEARAWHDWLDQTNISWTAWKLDGCEPPESCDSSCLFKDRTVSPSGPFDADSLNGHAPIVIDEMKTDLPAAGGSGGASGGTGGRPSTGGTSAGGTSPAVPGTAAPATGGSPPIQSVSSRPRGLRARQLLPGVLPDRRRLRARCSLQRRHRRARHGFRSVLDLGRSVLLIHGKRPGRRHLFQAGRTRNHRLSSASTSRAPGAASKSLSSVPMAPTAAPMRSLATRSPPSPDCWGLGAGPYAGLPVDQIEVRLRADFSGAATLRVADITYGP